MIGQKRLKFGGIPNYSPDIFQCEQTKNLMKMEALQKSLSQLNEFGKKEHDGAGEFTCLAPTRVSLQLAQERWPDIRFEATREQLERRRAGQRCNTPASIPRNSVKSDGRNQFFVLHQFLSLTEVLR